MANQPRSKLAGSMSPQHFDDLPTTRQSDCELQASRRLRFHIAKPVEGFSDGASYQSPYGVGRQSQAPDSGPGSEVQTLFPRPLATREFRDAKPSSNQESSTRFSAWMIWMDFVFQTYD